jgi:uncharacterized membrane protein
MSPKEFLANIDETAVVQAIQEAEKETSGEIRVYVSHSKRTDPMAYALRRFETLGMTKTKDRNAVLLYLVPKTRSFAIVGDTGVHAKCGEGFWKEACAEFTRAAHDQSLTEAIVRTIRKIGRLLAEHFPCQPGDINELPDSIDQSEED